MITVPADHVVLFAHGHVRVRFGTVLFIPGRKGLRATPQVLHHRPWPRERIVDDGDLVVGDIGIGLVDEDLLLDDSLVVAMQRQPARLVSARAAEATRLDLEHVIAAVAVGIAPFADRIAEQRRDDLLGPGPPVGEDAPVVVDMIDQDMSRLRRHHELDLAIEIGDARHARRPATISLVELALPAFMQVGLEDRLILRRERRLLSLPPRFADVEAPWPPDRTPLPAEIRIELVVPCLSVGSCDAQRSEERDGPDRSSMRHGVPPLDFIGIGYTDTGTEG